ncbi:MAG TPA: anti-sigma factor [Candidatus Limnocylindrales bacterium]|nr:anti-sigma factor [Candidatus Limnocylindrales bacterium]
MTDERRPGPGGAPGPAGTPGDPDGGAPGGLTCDQVRELAASFVLDALDADEAAAVRRHLTDCPEPHPEIAELGAVVPVLLESVPRIEPPAALRTRILDAAAADRQGRARPSAVTAMPPVSSTSVPPPTPIERSRATPRRTWIAAIAAVLAIALVGGWNLLLQGQLDQARNYEQQVATVLRVAGQPGALTAILTPEDGSGPTGIAAIDSQGAVRIAMRDLAPTSGPEVYEAWVIGGDGVPVAIGGFQVGPSGVAYFEGSGVPTESGIVLALTREPGPGATAPSGSPVSAGTATAG